MYSSHSQVSRNLQKFAKTYLWVLLNSLDDGGHVNSKIEPRAFLCFVWAGQVIPLKGHECGAYTERGGLMKIVYWPCPSMTWPTKHFTIKFFTGKTELGASCKIVRLVRHCRPSLLAWALFAFFNGTRMASANDLNIRGRRQKNSSPL